MRYAGGIRNENKFKICEFSLLMAHTEHFCWHKTIPLVILNLFQDPGPVKHINTIRAVLFRDPEMNPG